MTAPQTKNVSVGKPAAAGGIHSGPIGSDLPTDATSKLDDSILGLGYVSEEGLTNTIEVDTETITAWGGDTVLTVRTSRTETFTWSFIENTKEVMAEVYGQSNVTEEGNNLTVLHKNEEMDHRVYVFEILLSGNRVKRIVVPDGQVTEVGDVVYVDGEPIGYEVTLTTYADADGVTVYEYIADIRNDGDNGGDGESGK